MLQKFARMAYKGKVIRNPKTGQEIKFLQTCADTDGALLELQSTYHVSSSEPPLHLHPLQEELFTLEAGELTVRINGITRVLTKGEPLRVKENTPHAMWNASTGDTVVNWKVLPALNTEYFLETIMGLAVDGKTDKIGRPSIFQIALLSKKYSNVFRLAKPAYAIQKIIFSLLAPFAYVSGYRSDYKKYFS